jgi:hypothetical protein
MGMPAESIRDGEYVIPGHLPGKVCIFVPLSHALLAHRRILEP